MLFLGLCQKDWRFMRKLMARGKWLIFTGLVGFLVYEVWCIKSKYDFEQIPAQMTKTSPALRLIGSDKTFDPYSPILSWFWPERSWIFALPDRTFADRFFAFRAEYGQRQAKGIVMVDVDCTSKKLTWYDLDEPETAIPAHDLYGRPVKSMDGQVYRLVITQPEQPPLGWIHQFCETDWSVERKALVEIARRQQDELLRHAKEDK
jgi:hypothetical protein